MKKGYSIRLKIAFLLFLAIPLQSWAEVFPPLLTISEFAKSESELQVRVLNEFKKVFSTFVSNPKVFNHSLSLLKNSAMHPQIEASTLAVWLAEDKNMRTERLAVISTKALPAKDLQHTYHYYVDVLRMYLTILYRQTTYQRQLQDGLLLDDLVKIGLDRAQLESYFAFLITTAPDVSLQKGLFAGYGWIDQIPQMDNISWTIERHYFDPIQMRLQIEYNEKTTQPDPPWTIQDDLEQR